ncbi:type 1 fimbrial protein [Burkholderia aenigmatica]|uniref:fimbrial protein n=1 Tax=Burkholderia aenigmatica TaxID=2015348 RepID=UPI001F243452|nr:fimbrial protein [Burkholderia aenigmatica]UKD11437.1 type 1 fimbrial protein [Burkholderia aenigmatica]
MISIENRFIARILKYSLSLGIAWLGTINSAHAAPLPPPTQLVCVTSGNSWNEVNGGFTQFDFPKVVVPPQTPDGAVIATFIVNIPYSCPPNKAGNGGDGGYEVWALDRSGYPSQFPGVGRYSGFWTEYPIFEWIGFRKTNLETGQVMSVTSSQQQWGAPLPAPTDITGTIRVKYEMIKLSDKIYNAKLPLGPFRMLSFEFRRRWPGSGATGHHALTWTSSGSTIEPMKKSCDVTTTDVRVPMPPVSSGKLNGVGATAGDTGFNIGLSCKAGSNVFVTLTDLTDVTNRSDLLTLAQGSSATGVKLRVTRNGQPVFYGPDSAAVGNQNQWYVAPSSGLTNIPLSAQYVATGPVTAGTVKGVATFTMSYQ